MTVEDFEKRITDENGNTIIKVRRHKTFHKHGYAHVVLSQQKFNLLHIYMRHFRRLYERGDAHVFVSRTGNKMESGGVSRRINKIWKDSGVYGELDPPKRNVCGNVIRKSVSTLVQKNITNSTQDVADLMAHRITTAQNIYRVKKMEKTASKAAEAIVKATHVENRPSCSRER